jgi:hypothetical protein
MSTTNDNAAQQAESTAPDLRAKLAPVGLVGKGLLYASLGFIAINVALGDSDSEDTSKSGAIERVAEAPFGKFLMIVLAVGLVALVLWKATQAIAGDPVDGSEATDRAKYAVKAFLYAGSAVTAVTILIANWSGGSGGSSSSDGGSGGGKQKAAAVLMDLPAGRWLVMIAGIGIVGFGGYQFYKHVVNTEFMDKIESADEKTTNTIETIGRVGYGGRSALMIGIGVFFFVAGVQHDSDEVKGLSGLLGELAGDPWGQVALWVIAIGTFAYGVYTLIEAKYRRAY